MALGTTPEFEPILKRKTGRQKEAAVDKGIGAWGKTKGGELHKNRRGMVNLPGGGMFPYGLGPNGTGDRVGHLPILITPDMVGKRLPIYCEIEAKTETGRLSPEQKERQAYLSIIGAIHGVARNLEDCEKILEKWRAT